MNFAIAFAFGNVSCVSKSSTFHFCAEHGAGLKMGAKSRCLTLEKGHSTHSSTTLLSKCKAMNGTGHICVSMVDSAETTLVIYRKHCKIGCIYRNVYKTKLFLTRTSWSCLVQMHKLSCKWNDWLWHNPYFQISSSTYCTLQNGEELFKTM